MKNDKAFVVRLPADLLDQFDSVNEPLGAKREPVVRILIKKYIARRLVEMKDAELEEKRRMNELKRRVWAQKGRRGQ